MSDLISRSALIEMMDRYYNESYESRLMTPNHAEAFWMIHKLVANQPTVEAKPVVHCKDCEHWGTGVAGETEHVKCCEYGKYMVGEMGYCCYADMRGGKNE